ncbi:hypothetical protein Cni_G17987 [Canna indica]|uniref:Uncharacterized protein n=1 Tax=Canna indica TaxID=4628 RepID=A0AAQ3KIE5_9LILI|nr:hypothetical protein Cni_G17987 [Canna indica]
METREQAAMERTAGGKLTRRLFRRRSSSTPYDRPPLAVRQRGGFVSDIVARAASVILPSVFSSSSSLPAAAADTGKDRQASPSKSFSNSRQEEFDRKEKYVMVHSYDEQMARENNPGVIAEKSQPNANPSIDNHLSEKARNVCDSDDITEIELWIKQRTFSSDQSNHIMEILRSRTSNHSHHNPCTAIGSEADGALDSNAPMEPSLCGVVSEQWLKPKPQDTTQMKVVSDVSSPAEIAKAFIKGREAESCHKSYDGRLEMETSTFYNGVCASKIPPSVSKSLVCWQETPLENNNSYFTPNNTRTKVGRHSFQRTLYSGSIFSRSKFQGGRENQKNQNVPLPIWERYTSGGVMVPEKHDGSIYSEEFNNSHLPSASFPTSSASKDATKSFSSTLKLTSEKDSLGCSLNSHNAEASENSMGLSSVHPKSSQNARKILEHLNITIPPKEKIIHLDLVKADTKIMKDPSSTLRAPEKELLAAANSSPSTNLLPSFTPMSRKQTMMGATEKSSDKGFGFTFPVSTSLDDSSEPSTPTLTSSPAACRMISNTANSSRAFSFGPRRKGQLIFPVQRQR